jgi:hypothetical protein
MVEGRRAKTFTDFLQAFYAKLIPSMRWSPRDLISSLGPHFLMQLHWLIEFGKGCKHSNYSIEFCKNN